MEQTHSCESKRLSEAPTICYCSKRCNESWKSTKRTSRGASYPVVHSFFLAKPSRQTVLTPSRTESVSCLVIPMLAIPNETAPASLQISEFAEKRNDSKKMWSHQSTTNFWCVYRVDRAPNLDLMTSTSTVQRIFNRETKLFFLAHKKGKRYSFEQTTM